MGAQFRGALQPGEFLTLAPTRKPCMYSRAGRETQARVFGDLKDEVVAYARDFLTNTLDLSEVMDAEAGTKEGGSEAQLEQARDYCVAENESTEPGGGSEWLNARLVGNHFVRCMESKGWTRVPVHEE